MRESVEATLAAAGMIQAVEFAASLAQIHAASMTAGQHAGFTGTPARSSGEAGGAWSA